MTTVQDQKGVLVTHFNVHHEKVTNATCSKLLQTKLKPAIHTKCHGALTIGVICNMAMLANTCNECIEELGFELLPYPPNISDLTRSDFNLFDPMKEVL